MMNMIRNLAGLIITLSMLPICCLSFRFASNIPFSYKEINDELALFQLRETMLIAYDLQYSFDQLDFIYANKEFRLSQVNNRLILQPGTQIFLDDIDEVYFEKRNGCIYVHYQRDNKQYERILCKEGIYIDRFSDCDVLTDEPDSTQE